MAKRAGFISTSVRPFSAPDGNHLAYVGATASKGLTPLEVQAGKTTPQNVCVVLDGVEQKHFAKIEQVTFSQDSKHLAYLAGIDQLSLTRAVVDDHEGPAYSNVQQLIISDDASRSAYIATKRFTPAPLANGMHNPPHDVYVVVDNGKEGPAYDVQITRLCISHNGNRVAYVAQGTKINMVVVDNGKLSPQYRGCENLQISPDGKTVLYVATGAQGQFLVANGQEYGPFGGTNSNPAFSPEGGHWACCVSLPAGGFAVIADGKTIALKGIAPGALVFQPGTGQLMMRSTNSYNGTPVMVELKGDAVSAADVPSDIVYSPNHEHVAKLITSGYGTSEVKQQVAIDDKSPSAANYTGISKIAISDDGRHVAFIGSYIGENGKALTHAIHDGTEGPGYWGIKDLALSPDGRHLAYVAEKSNGHGIDTYVVVDGMEGPAFQDVLIDGAYTGQGMGAYQDYHQVRFASDGSLRFLPVLNGQLYRCSYAAGALKGLPSLAAHEAEKPGPRDVHNFVRPNVFSDPATAIHFVLGPDETIYGISDADGKFKKGTLYKVKTDGTGFAVLHDFFGGDEDGERPLSLLLGPDGGLFGTLDGRKMFRYDIKSGDYALLNLNTNGSIGPNLLEGFSPDRSIVGFCGGTIIDTPAVFSMALDGSNYLSLVNSQFGKPPRMYSQIVAGTDGTFFAIGMFENKASIVKFKSLKDTPTLVHKFANTPNDGIGPNANLVLDHQGNLYGSTSGGGMSQHGVLYKVSADGSNYRVVYNPDEFAFTREFVPGDDGMLYGIAKEGLLRLNPDGSGQRPTVVVAFDGAAYTMYRGNTPNIFFHNGAVYGLHNKAIYKVTLPQAGAGTASVAATATINTVAPPPPASEAITFTDPSGTATAGSAAGSAAGGESTPVASVAPAGASVSGYPAVGSGASPNAVASAAEPNMNPPMGASTGSTAANVANVATALADALPNGVGSQVAPLTSAAASAMNAPTGMSTGATAANVATSLADALPNGVGSQAAPITSAAASAMNAPTGTSTGATVANVATALAGALPNGVGSQAAPIVSEAAPLVQMAFHRGTKVQVKMVDAVDSNQDPAGKEYRATVVQRIIAANGVVIPAGATATVTLVQDGSGAAAHLTSLAINGQPVPVSGSSASVIGGVRKIAGAASSLLGMFGSRASALASAANTASALTAATGERVVLPQGTRVSFVLDGNQ